MLQVWFVKKRNHLDGTTSVSMIMIGKGARNLCSTVHIWRPPSPGKVQFMFQGTVPEEGMSKKYPDNTGMKTSGKEALKIGPGRTSHPLKIEPGTKSQLLIAICIPTKEPVLTNMENI